MRKTSRILLTTALVAGFLLVLVTGAVLYVGLTETGTAWVLNRVRTSINSAPGTTVQWRQAEGTLLSGLDVRDFSFASTPESGPVAITIPHLTFSLQPLGLLKYAVVINALQIDDLSYSADGAVQDTPPLTADELSAMLFDLPVSIELQQVVMRNFSWRRNGSSFVLDNLTGSASLNSDELQLTKLQLQQGTTQVSGDLSLDNALEVEGDINWQTRIDERDYGGALDVAGSLQQLQLRHVLSQPLQINSSGALVPGFLQGPELSVDLRHTFDTLDLAAFGVEGIVLQQGDIVTTGSLQTLGITGSLQGLLPDLEPLTLNLDLNYKPEVLAVNSLQLDSVQIAMTAVGTLQLDPQSLQLDWMLTRFDPGAALPNVRFAEITGEGSVAMNNTAEGQQITVTLARLDGLLNELPLRSSGMLELADAKLSALDLQVSSGANVFAIKGTAAQVIDLDWQLQAPQLQQLWQGLDGGLTGQGSIGGTFDAPEINGQLNGSQISLQQNDRMFSLQSLRAQAQASATGSEITLNLGMLSMQPPAPAAAMQKILEQASIVIAGTPANHNANANIAFANADLVFKLNGSLAAEKWQGTLQSSSISGNYGNWQQEAGVALAYESGGFAIDESCWNYVLIRFCAQGEQAAGSGLNANLNLRNVPLSWLDSMDAGTSSPLTPKPIALQELQNSRNFYLPAGLEAEGDIDAQIRVKNFAGGSWDSLDIELMPENTVLQVDFAQGSVEDLSQPEVERFAFTTNTLRVGNSADGWSGEADLNIAKQTVNGPVPQGNISAQIAMTASQEINGDVAFGFNELGWIETLVPGLREPHGVLNGRVNVAGTRFAPELTGRVQLADAGFAVPDYGLVITDIELLLQNLVNNEFVLEGSATSGDGSLALTTTLSNLSTEDRAVTAAITGTDFTVINTGYARANISPQLELVFANEELSVSGGVTLPLLDLDLEGMFATADRGGVDVSRDVVVINTTEAAAVADRQAVAVPLHADVSLLLGEDVRLRGYGLNTRLNGELSLEQAPNRPALVYGELGIPEGSFEIYNQVLNAKDGRLMFFGNPANPVVDIRAFRETNDAEVGMLLSGSIKNMQGKLYSSPDLPEDEILALLITGKSFNNINDQDGSALLGAIANFGFERSDGLTNKVSSKMGFDSLTVESGSTLQDSALGLGKYITPDLLMRYKIGLFDRQSALSIDYNLTEHIKLEVETGISQSVDISYTIETD